MLAWARLKLEQFVVSHTIPRVSHLQRRRLADCPPLAPGEASFDHTDWDALLKAHVTVGVSLDGVTGVSTIDYAGVAADPRFDAYLAKLASASMDTLPPAEVLALLINAYNAFAVGLVVETENVDGIS